MSRKLIPDESAYINMFVEMFVEYVVVCLKSYSKGFRNDDADNPLHEED